MIFARDLALRGLGVLAAGGGLALVGYHYKGPISNLLGFGESLLEKVGLSCNGENVCTPIGGTKINVKHGNTKEEGKTLTIPAEAKLRLHILSEEDSNYPEKIRIVVEGGDISLTGTGAANSISKLSRYESYAVEKVTEQSGDKYFLSRKAESNGGIKDSLGLPCDLPASTTNASECTELNGEKLKLINFKDKGETGATIASGNAKLTISLLTNQETEFPHNYKFVLESPSGSGNITVPGNPQITIKSGEKMEFKIGNKTGSDALFLERAWSLETLIKKVGLKGCTTNNPECQIDDSAGGGLKVKQGDSSAENKGKQGNPSGKIKLYTGGDAEGYNEGFKFVIEEGDIALSNGSTPNKLEEFETYEIKESGGKYYLTRREKKLEAQWRLLGLPGGDNCKFPEDDSTTLTCDLDKAKLGTIKFQGKADGGTITIDGEQGSEMKLKVSKTSSGPFKESGYKLVLETNKNISIGKSTGTISIKKGTNTEFRIKSTAVSGGPKTLTLEKAWTVEELGQKSAFYECWGSGNSKKCTFKNNVSFNVMNGTGSSDKFTDAKITSSEQTMSYEEDVEDHNQGFKFLTDSDISVGTGTDKKIHGKSSGTYEIVEKSEGNSTKWYLSKRTVSG